MNVEVWEPSCFFDKVDHLRDDISWHRRQQEKYTLHPSVHLMIKAHRPVDFSALALEFPHVCDKDASRLSYTRTPADGANDRVLVTSLGKYLARHWPHTKDDVRRDVQAAYSPDTLAIFDTMEDMVRIIENGPRSCMASVFKSIPFTEHDNAIMNVWFADKTQPEPDWTKHPYTAYRPEYGWRAAARITASGSIDGRALLYKDGGDLIFLRTYKRNMKDPTGWSETDFTLQEWLKYGGYKMVSAWPLGAKLHTPDIGDGKIFAPYLDGGRQVVTFDGDTTSTIAETYDYTHACTQTSANVYERERPDEDEDDEREYCDSCDSHHLSDDMRYAGRNDDIYLCNDCRDNDYTWVRGESRHNSYCEYYAHNNDTSFIHNHNYEIDTNCPPDNVVQLEDGDWAETDDCVSIDGEYYLEDDADVVYLEDNDDLDDIHGLKRDCYEVDGKWWRDEDHYLEFHPVEDEVEDLIETTVT